MRSLQSRLNSALSSLSTSIHTLYNSSIVLIIATTIPLALFLFSINPPLVIIPLLLGIVAGIYVTYKKNSLLSLVSDSDSQSARLQIARRVVVKVADSVLDGARDSVLIGPIALVIVSIVSFIFSVKWLGWLALSVAVIMLASIFCIAELVRLLVHKWVDSVFDGNEGDKPREDSPLITS